MSRQDVLDVRERMVVRKWRVWERVWRVEYHRRTGMWWAVGKMQGKRRMYLDKLGPRMCKVEMQNALDRWARARGGVEVISNK